MLCGIVLGESAILLAIAREAAQIRSQLIAHADSPVARDDREGLAAGSLAPQFTARELNDSAQFTSQSLTGVSNALLFLDSNQAGSLSPTLVVSIVTYLLSKIDGKVHVICKGSQAQCQVLCDDTLSVLYRAAELVVLVDPMGEIARMYRMNSSPSSVLVDRAGRIVRSGRYAEDAALSAGSK